MGLALGAVIVGFVMHFCYFFLRAALCEGLQVHCVMELRIVLSDGFVMSEVSKSGCGR